MTLEGFVVGVAIAMAEHAGLIRPRRGRGLALLSVSAAILCIWLASHDFMARIGFHDAALQPVLIALLAGAIILGAVMLAGSPMPLTQPARALSRLSYSLYLVHLPLIPLAKVLSGTQEVDRLLGDLPGRQPRRRGPVASRGQSLRCCAAPDASGRSILLRWRPLPGRGSDWLSCWLTTARRRPARPPSSTRRRRCRPWRRRAAT